MAGSAAKRFAISGLGTAFAIAAIGWFTAAKLVAHAALLIMAAAALLPFLILAAVLVLPLVALMSFGTIGLLLGLGMAPELIGEAAWPAGRLGVSVVPWYYRLLARQRHPLFWGVAAGLVLGVAALWALIAIFIIPGESRTAEILAQTQATIEQTYKAKGSYPKPDAEGHLSRSALASTGSGTPADGVVLDGFGRPVQYEVKGAWKVASYSLVSHGFDGVPGADDLRLSSSTRLGRLTDATASLLRALRREPGAPPATVQIKLRGIRELQQASRD